MQPLTYSNPRMPTAILDRFQTDEVEDLGLFAARAEVHAEERDLNPWERQALLNRADHYRDLQVAALAKFGNNIPHSSTCKGALND